MVAEGKLIAEHPRCFSRERLLLDPLHYLPVLERKPGALRHGAPFQNWALPVPVATVKARLMQTPQGDRAFVEILQALQEHGMEQASVACELALEHRTVTAPVILNHLHRLVSSPLREVDQVSHCTDTHHPAGCQLPALRQLAGGAPCSLS